VVLLEVSVVNIVVVALMLEVMKMLVLEPILMMLVILAWAWGALV